MAFPKEKTVSRQCPVHRHIHSHCQNGIILNNAVVYPSLAAEAGLLTGKRD